MGFLATYDTAQGGDIDTSSFNGTVAVVDFPIMLFTLKIVIYRDFIIHNVCSKAILLCPSVASTMFYKKISPCRSTSSSRIKFWDSFYR